VGWQKAISYLGLTEYVPHVREAFRRGEIDPGYMESEDFKRDLAASLSARGRGDPFTADPGCWIRSSGDHVIDQRHSGVPR
jgi:hypothetical protein